MAGAALLPRHGGFTSGPWMGSRTEGLKSRTWWSGREIKTPLSRQMSADLSSHTFVDGKAEKDTEKIKIKIMCHRKRAETVGTTRAFIKMAAEQRKMRQHLEVSGSNLCEGGFWLLSSHT